MELVYLEGDFTFITNESERLMIQDAYESMNKVEGGMDEMKKTRVKVGICFHRHRLYEDLLQKN